MVQTSIHSIRNKMNPFTICWLPATFQKRSGVLHNPWGTTHHGRAPPSMRHEITSFHKEKLQCIATLPLHIC